MSDSRARVRIVHTCWIALLSESRIAAFWRIGIAALISPFASKIYKYIQKSFKRIFQGLFFHLQYYDFKIRTFPFLNSALTFSGWHRRTLSTDVNATSNADIFIWAAARLLYTLTRVSNNSWSWSFENCECKRISDTCSDFLIELVSITSSIFDVSPTYLSVSSKYSNERRYNWIAKLYSPRSYQKFPRSRLWSLWMDRNEKNSVNVIRENEIAFEFQERRLELKAKHSNSNSNWKIQLYPIDCLDEYGTFSKSSSSLHSSSSAV